MAWLHPLFSWGGGGLGPRRVLSALSSASLQEGRQGNRTSSIYPSKWFFSVFCSSEVLQLTSCILQFA